MPQFSIITIFFVLLLSASALDFCQYIIDDDTIYGFYGVPALNISSHFINETTNGTIMFDLCGSAITPCQTYAAGSTNYIAVAFNGTNTSDCQNIAAGAVATASFIDSSDASDGVILTFPSVSTANSSITNTLVVTVTCDSSISASDMVWTSVLTVFSNGSSIYNLTSNGDPGCPEISLENFMEFFTAYEGYFAICLFVIGGFTLFFGLKFHKITIFIYSTILIFLITFVILEIVTGAKAGGVLQWILFAFCIIGGLGFGYVAIRWPKVGFFAMGAVGGGVAAFFIYSLILHFVSGLTKWAMYGFIAGLAVITGLLAIWLWEFLIIVVMSFVGAYMTVRSISFFIGGFPNELSVIEGFEQYDNTDYVYLGVMIAIAIMGMVFQFSRRRDALKAKRAKAERKKKIEMTDNSKIDAGNESKTDIESELL